MWVKDFDTNEAVRMLNLPEVGLFLLCLNHAWINDGLPDDDESIRLMLKISRGDFKKYWPKVSKTFEKVGERLKNKRQEEEREEVLTISKRNTENIRKRYDRTTTVEESNVSGTTRAFVCVSGSVSGSSPEEISSSKEFGNFWARWGALTHRIQRHADALRAWIGVVEPGEESAVMACLERYGASDEVLRGVVCNPEKWLYEQARDDWRGDWPAPKSALDIRSEALRRAIGDD